MGIRLSWDLRNLSHSSFEHQVHHFRLAMTTHPDLPHGSNSLYGYVPTEWICSLFIALFGFFGLIHLAQAIRFRTWWLLPTAVAAAIGEVIGWSGRLWSSKNPTFLPPYLMQITTTIISPTPLIAANFVILGKLIRLVGVEYSRLGPNMYTIIFCAADLVALIIQAVGGASASEAVENNRDPEKGGHIMLAGIVFQMVSIIFYTALALEFLTRVILRKPVHPRVPPSAISTPGIDGPTSGTATPEKETIADTVVQTRDERLSWTKVKLLVIGLGFSTLCIFVRSVYRTIELSNGFAGFIIHQQRLFNWLDGAMIVLALATWNFLHPGWLLPNGPGW